MSILIDPALWPAHGTVFAHLVSDESLTELHAFAERAGLSERAFDLDHYDVPAHRRAALIEAGAVPVSAGELIRRLRASGLRVPARDRHPALLADLRARWAGTGLDPALGADLIDAWSQAHRRYHDLRHLRAVLESLDQLCAPKPAPLTARLAAWFHDAVYEGQAGRDEQRSAAWARSALSTVDVPGLEVEEAERLVLLTAGHDPQPDDHHGALLCDADLAVLGRPAPQYRRYTQDVRAEYAHVPDDAFRTGRLAVVRRLLALDPLYRTPRAQQWWGERASQNLRAEEDLLTRPDPGAGPAQDP